MQLTPLACPSLWTDLRLLFCRDQALSMDEVMNLLQISKGSASQGLRALKQFGAVSSSFAPRRPQDASLPRFASQAGKRFSAGQADPHLDKGVARLKQIEGLLEVSDSQDSRTRGTRRHEILSGWHRQMSRLPWVKMIVGKSDRLPQKNKD